ncbi:MAG: radical SAM protein [Deltaproteobacteria bacterium]|nr:radical SAM protein [Deltaproteobacteria bacterium]
MAKHQSPVQPTAGPPFAAAVKADPARFLAKAFADPLSGAFSERFAIHAGRAGEPVSGPEAARAHLERLASPGGSCAFYVHLPFCRGRCLFCGFAGRSPDGGAGAAYCEAAASEIEFMAGAVGQRGPVRAVYFGGGTPSSMAPADLARLLSAVRSCLPLANDCEITLEGAVHDFTPDAASAFLDAGFNRFSIGIQRPSTPPCGGAWAA